MFDAVRNNKKIVQIFLVLIMLPFAFFGVDSYVRNMGAGADVAKVGAVKISFAEFDQSLRRQQDEMRERFGEKFDPKMIENKIVRRAILDDLINRKLLLQEAEKQRLFVSDAAVKNFILREEAFQVEGTFNQERYESLLASQGTNPAFFEHQMREDLVLQRLLGALWQSSFMAKTAVDRVIALQTEERKVATYRLPLADFEKQVKLADGAALARYESKVSDFETPEMLRAEFVMLSADSIASSLKISDAEIKAWYESHRKDYATPEERRASHILLNTETTKDKAAVRVRAESLLEELKKNPDSFAEVAKKNSEDTGSAESGGDLGYFKQDQMVPAFSEAAFALKKGEISGIVETNFGFHIIKLSDIRPQHEKPLTEVEADIVEQLRRSTADKKFAEAAESFSNMVYEEADSLQPVVEKYALKLQKTDWLTRETGVENTPLANPKVLAALFSEESIKNHRNTAAVEIAPKTLLSARVIEHKPVLRQPFLEVRAAIEKQLIAEEAAKIARAKGEEVLAALRSGNDQIKWAPAQPFSRVALATDPKLLPPDVANAIFRLSADKLPAYDGMMIPPVAYLLLKLVEVKQNESISGLGEGVRVQLDRLQAEAEVRAYIEALRVRHKVEINEKALGTEGT